MLNIGLAKLIDVWFSLRDGIYSKPSPRSSLSLSKNGLHLEYAYITPAIIAAWTDTVNIHSNISNGHEDTLQLQNLLQDITNGQPAMLWDLGDMLNQPGNKIFAETLKQGLYSNVIQSQWTCPCDYTKAPTIEYLLSLCSAIRSWYSLHSSHLCIFLCPNGLPNAGIIIATLLRCIGAFPKCVLAYDYYCVVRAKAKRSGDPLAGITEASLPNHSATAFAALSPDSKPGSSLLAASYQLLFRNMDSIFSHSSASSSSSHGPFPSFQLNEKYLFLKVVTVSGLPVEDMPCLEVFDLTGLVFSSHVDRNGQLMCR